MKSTITDKNMRENNGKIYVSGGVDKDGQRITLCPTTGRRLIASVQVCTGGFMVVFPDGRGIQQYVWAPTGGRAGLVEAARYLAKRTLEVSFAGKYGAVGFVRAQADTSPASSTWAAWGYDRDNAPCGSASVETVVFDVLVPVSP